MLEYKSNCGMDDRDIFDQMTFFNRLTLKRLSLINYDLSTW